MNAGKRAAPTIMVYKFTGVYVDTDICDLGVIVYDEDRYSSLKISVDDVLCRKMGYMSQADYDNSYPSNFSNDSNIKSAYIGDISSKHLILNNIYANPCAILGGFKDIFEFSDIVSPEQLQLSFIVPTIDEAAKLKSATNANYEYFWFCSDWGDDCDLVEQQEIMQTSQMLY